MLEEVELFEHKVLELVRLRRLTEEEAIRDAVTTYPVLHAEFMARIRRGGRNLLPELLRKYGGAL